MSQILAIAIGGAAGALSRYWFSNGVHALIGRDFPYGTLMVNVVGSLVMGLLYVLLIERSSLGPEWRALLLVGFLGSFTTFSTFSIETVNLLEAEAYLKAGLNVLLNVVLCIVGTGIGMIIARKL